MKNIFDIIDGKQDSTTQAPTTITSPKQPEQIPKQTFMQQLIAQGKENLDRYKLIPLRKFKLRSKVVKELKVNLSWCFLNNRKYIDFNNCLRLAKHKNINITKIKMKTDFLSDKVILNPLEYVLFNFSVDPEIAIKLVKFLLANEPRFLTQKNLDKAMQTLFKNNTQMGRLLLRSGKQKFIELYKLLIDNGATGSNVVNLLFSGLGCSIYITENPSIIEMFLYENNPAINEKIFNAFYNCNSPSILLPILEKYGFKPDIYTAIINTRYENGPEILRFLIKAGKIDAKDLTTENIDRAILYYDIEGSDMSKIEHCVKEIAQEELGQMPTKKISQKSQITATTKEEQIVDKIFETAVKIVEQEI